MADVVFIIEKNSSMIVITIDVVFLEVHQLFVTILRSQKREVISWWQAKKRQLERMKTIISFSPGMNNLALASNILSKSIFLISRKKRQVDFKPWKSGPASQEYTI